MFPILSLLVSLSWADTTTQPKAYAMRIYPQIAAQSLRSSYHCDDSTCDIEWDPAPVFSIVIDDKMARLSQLRALLQKWKDGTITAAEKDALLKAFLTRFFDMD